MPKPKAGTPPTGSFVPLAVSSSLKRQFNDHAAEWLPCQKCYLCRGRRNVCLYRGALPCDVLFIGEAPGESEDALGYPFVGPAGKELDSLYQAACFSSGYVAAVSGEVQQRFLSTPVEEPLPQPRYGITNIVACIPRTEELYATGELRVPKKDEAAACQPRLLEIIQMANPRAIVCLGEIAKRFFPKQPIPGGQRWEGRVRHLIHPSAILHAEIPSHASLLRKKFVIALSNVLKELT